MPSKFGNQLGQLMPYVIELCRRPSPTNQVRLFAICLLFIALPHCLAALVLGQDSRLARLPAGLCLLFIALLHCLAVLVTDGGSWTARASGFCLLVIALLHCMAAMVRKEGSRPAQE